MVPLLVIAGFLIGSIPFGVIVARSLGVDIRQRGSGNIGATNVARVIGFAPGLLVLALDAGKGAAATALAMHVCGFDWVVVATGFAAILGHCFSPFLRGRGGKGVATALGVFVVVSPPLALVAVSVFLLVAGGTRIPALGSLGGVTSATVFAFVTSTSAPVRALAIATLVLLVYTHRGNLRRLLTKSP